MTVESIRAERQAQGWDDQSDESAASAFAADLLANATAEEHAQVITRLLSEASNNHKIGGQTPATLLRTVELIEQARS